MPEPEPVAAARQHGVAGPVAVYDLGGSTFDVTVLGADGAVVGRPGGDPDLGGEVFDQLVYRHFGAQLAHAAPGWWEQLGSDPERLVAEADLLTEARLAKETFETASQYVAGADADVLISHAELDTLIGDDARRTARLLAEAAAGIELVAVLLTGGAARTPLVERILREQHGALVRTSDDPKGGGARRGWPCPRRVPARGARAGSPPLPGPRRVARADRGGGSRRAGRRRPALRVVGPGRAGRGAPHRADRPAHRRRRPQDPLRPAGGLGGGRGRDHRRRATRRRAAPPHPSPPTCPWAPASRCPRPTARSCGPRAEWAAGWSPPPPGWRAAPAGARRPASTTWRTAPATRRPRRSPTCWWRPCRCRPRWRRCPTSTGRRCCSGWAGCPTRRSRSWWGPR